METKTYTTLDRSRWPSGAWDSEPDKMQWPDAATGLPCLAVRHPGNGHWCGYVGVADDHPLHGASYESVDLDVHGGLTFAAPCRPGETESRGICHTPAPGEPDHVWWLGFDCAHLGDHSPMDVHYAVTRGYRLSTCPDSQYRSLDYVRQQCAHLAAQIAAVNAKQ